MPGFEHLWDLNELDSGLTEAKLTTQKKLSRKAGSLPALEALMVSLEMVAG